MALRARAFLLLLLGFTSVHGAVRIGGGLGLTVSIDDSGAYDIFAPDLGWHFGGMIGYPISNLATGWGADAAGDYSEVAFDFQSDAVHHAAMRSYWRERAILFTMTSPSGAPNTLSLPSLTQYPRNLNHIGFAGMFAFATFFGYPGEGPWVFFDGSANTFILSPAMNFMVAQTAWGPNGELAGGISSKIATLPQGFTQQTLLVVDNGINRAFDTWGRTLTALRGKVRPANDADPSLKMLGYWTDAGATYYYHTQDSLSYEQTLTAVKSDFDRLGIGLGYIQLDSWFYPKGSDAAWNDRSGGIFEYFAAPPLFSGTLADFQQTIGAGLITHARWIDANSPYRQLYGMSGDVSTDAAYWNNVAGYLAASGVVVYEQDWLADHAQTAFNLTDPNAFLDNMAAALGQQGINMQYCMPNARHFLQGSKYSNLTSIRASDDRFGSARWRNFLYASRLASALGIWPFTDVFMSGETENLLLATLSAGPVGVGDAIGTLNAANLLRAARLDGVIVKPDAPLVPLDSSFLNDAQVLNAPLAASTYTAFNNRRTVYLFAFPQRSSTQVQFRPADMGMSGAVYVYDYFANSGLVVDAAAAMSAAITASSLYLVLAPVGPSGIAVLGDTGQFVTMGRKRVTAYGDDGTVHLTIAFANGESARSIQGYAPDAPQAWAAAGSVGAMNYDPVTKQFQVVVMPGPDGTASIRLARSFSWDTAPNTGIERGG